ncbi:pentapeptide repeat-containing protein [Chamaesiphon minutus]
MLLTLVNLSGVDFSGQDLSECFMPGINLSGSKSVGGIVIN